MIKKLEALIFRNEKYLFPVIIIIIGFSIRFSLYDIESLDFKRFLSVWFDSIKDNGGFSGLSAVESNYSPAYLFFMSILTYIPLPSMVLVKSLSCIGDVFLAIYVKKCVDKIFPDKNYGIYSFAIAFLLPTVIINSSMWAQSDALFTAGLIACLYYFLSERPFAASIAFGIAFCIKLQAVFFAPFLLILVLKGKLKIRYIPLMLAPYLLFCIPSLIAGRGLMDLLLIYVGQTGTYSSVSLGCANLYIWISETAYGPELILPIILFAVSIIFCFVYYVWRKRVELNREMLFLLALFSSMLMPFILPLMHERYFFVADILMIIFAFMYPKKLFIPIIQWLTSLYVYCHYFYIIDFMPTGFLGIATFINIVLVGRELYFNMRKNQQTDIITATDG